MEYLITNTANQTLRLTLDEARQYYATPFTHYLLIITHEENSSVGNSLSQVAVVTAENQRITTLQVTTVGLTLSGRYRYEVYGQNSASNLLPTNVSVVGICEKGLLELTNSTEYYEVPSINISNVVIYNG
jgi:hypothetical protein